MSICTGCGAGAPPGAAFCPWCGVPVTAEQPQLTVAGPMSPWASPDSTYVLSPYPGEQITEAIPVPLPPLFAGPPPPRRRKSRLWIVPVLIGVLLLGSGAAAVAASRATPQSTAEAYLEAVARGDASAALALRATVESHTGLLTDTALRASGVERPKNIRVTAVTKTGTTARVTLAYVLDSLPKSLDLTLRRTGLLPVPTWRIDSPLGLVQPAVNHTVTTTVAGVEAGAAGLSALPARYPVQESDPSGFFDTATGQVVVADRPVGPRAELNLSGSGKTRVVTAVQTAEQQCLAGERDDCPFTGDDLPGYQRVGFDAIITEPSWNYRVTADGVQLITTAPGLIACTTQTYDGRAGQQSLAYRADAAVSLSSTGEVAVTFG